VTRSRSVTAQAVKLGDKERVLGDQRIALMGWDHVVMLKLKKEVGETCSASAKS